MLHALPAKPAFLGPPPTTSTLPSLPIASSSKSSSIPAPFLSRPASCPPDPTKCALCSEPPKYTCPRCSRRTCSLPCSTTHKSKYSCTGIRDPGGFVPLKTYGQGEWAEDYRWLEEGRRRVEGWGKGVKEEEVNKATSSIVRAGRGDSGGRANIRGGVDVRGRGRKSKTYALQMELKARGVWAEFMPEGMGRRRLNQSTWNARSGILSLTIQLSIPQELLRDEPVSNPPPDTPIIAPSQAAQEALEKSTDTVNGDPKGKGPTSDTALGAASTGIKLILHPRVLLVHPTKPLPTLTSLLPPLQPSAPSLVFLLPFHPSPARPAPPPPSTLPRPRLFFPLLNPDTPIIDIIKGTSWVEFPTIHILPRDEWDTGLKEGRYGVVELAQPRKRGFEIEDGQGEMGRTSRWNWAGQAKNIETLKGGGGEVRKRVRADEALGALGEYVSDEDDDDDEEGDVGEAGDIGEPEEEDGGSGEDEDEDVVLEHQPGSLLAGLPPDLLVAMSHAINTDLS